VNTASRMCSTGAPSAIQCSQASANLLEHEYHLDPQGAKMIKGKGMMQTYFIHPRAAHSSSRRAATHPLANLTVPSGSRSPFPTMSGGHHRGSPSIEMKSHLHAHVPPHRLDSPREDAARHTVDSFSTITNEQHRSGANGVAVSGGILLSPIDSAVLAAGLHMSTLSPVLYVADPNRKSHSPSPPPSSGGGSATSPASGSGMIISIPSIESPPIECVMVVSATPSSQPPHVMDYPRVLSPSHAPMLHALAATSSVSPQYLLSSSPSPSASPSASASPPPLPVYRTPAFGATAPGYHNASSHPMQLDEDDAAFAAPLSSGGIDAPPPNTDAANSSSLQFVAEFPASTWTLRLSEPLLEEEFHVQYFRQSQHRLSTIIPLLFATIIAYLIAGALTIDHEFLKYFLAHCHPHDTRIWSRTIAARRGAECIVALTAHQQRRRWDTFAVIREWLWLSAANDDGEDISLPWVRSTHTRYDRQSHDDCDECIRVIHTRTRRAELHLLYGR
jgi:hypothetical protein